MKQKHEAINREQCEIRKNGKDIKSADELRQIFKEAKILSRKIKTQVEDSPYMAEYNQWLGGQT